MVLSEEEIPKGEDQKDIPKDQKKRVKNQKVLKKSLKPIADKSKARNTLLPKSNKSLKDKKPTKDENSNISFEKEGFMLDTDKDGNVILGGPTTDGRRPKAFSIDDSDNQEPEKSVGKEASKPMKQSSPKTSKKGSVKKMNKKEETELENSEDETPYVSPKGKFRPNP
jgi:hypothetical protein